MFILMQKNLTFKGGSSENLPALYTPPKKRDYVVNINDNVDLHCCELKNIEIKFNEING